MGKTVFLVWVTVKDTEGDESAVWNNELECMTVVYLAAVCDDPVIADCIIGSIRALKVWKTECPLNTLRGGFA
jgi:hypothetical protein